MNLNKVYLINEADKTIINKLYKRHDKKNNKTGLIVGIIVAAFVVAVLAFITAYLCFKKGSRLNPTSNEQNIFNIIENSNYNKTSDNLDIN